jgi:hypothetical protein
MAQNSNADLMRIENNDYEKKRIELDSDYDPDEIRDESLELSRVPFDFLIIDCSPINFIDSVGIKMIKEVK